MLRLFVVIVVLFAAVPAVSAQSVSDSSIVARIYHDLARGDVAAVSATLDHHVIWIEDAESPRVKRHFGPGTIALYVLWPQVHAGIKDVPDTISTRGSRVIVVGTTRQTEPETGQVSLASFRHVWRVDDGRVVSVKRSARRPASADATPID